jgi:hypothetical protein
MPCLSYAIVSDLDIRFNRRRLRPELCKAS